MSDGTSYLRSRDAARVVQLAPVGNNKLRHETLQRFMLTNDSVTVAIEIPIWLTESDIAALEKQYGIELAPLVGAAERSITGHIDFLQVRNGAVHILDYKPDDGSATDQARRPLTGCRNHLLTELSYNARPCCA